MASDGARVGMDTDGAGSEPRGVIRACGGEANTEQLGSNMPTPQKQGVGLMGPVSATPGSGVQDRSRPRLDGASFSGPPPAQYVPPLSCATSLSAGMPYGATMSGTQDGTMRNGVFHDSSGYATFGVPPPNIPGMYGHVQHGFTPGQQWAVNSTTYGSAAHQATQPQARADRSKQERSGGTYHCTERGSGVCTQLELMPNRNQSKRLCTPFGN